MRNSGGRLFKTGSQNICNRKEAREFSKKDYSRVEAAVDVMRGARKMGNNSDGSLWLFSIEFERKAHLMAC